MLVVWFGWSVVSLPFWMWAEAGEGLERRGAAVVIEPLCVCTTKGPRGAQGKMAWHGGGVGHVAGGHGELVCLHRHVRSQLPCACVLFSRPHTHGC